MPRSVMVSGVQWLNGGRARRAGWSRPGTAAPAAARAPPMHGGGRAKAGRVGGARSSRAALLRGRPAAAASALHANIQKAQWLHGHIQKAGQQEGQGGKWLCCLSPHWEFAVRGFSARGSESRHNRKDDKTRTESGYSVWLHGNAASATSQGLNQDCRTCARWRGTTCSRLPLICCAITKSAAAPAGASARAAACPPRPLVRKHTPFWR